MSDQIMTTADVSAEELALRVLKTANHTDAPQLVPMATVVRLARALVAADAAPDGKVETCSLSLEDVEELARENASNPRVVWSRRQLARAALEAVALRKKVETLHDGLRARFAGKLADYDDHGEIIAEHPRDLFDVAERLRAMLGRSQ